MGQIGCSMSHFEILKKAKKENLKNYLVFEDDFSLEYEPDILFDYLNKSISDLPDDWDMFYLGCNLDSSYGVFPIEKWSSNLYKLNSCHTTHAFSVNNKIYDLILKGSPKMENESLIKWHNENTTIDVFFSKHILFKNKCFISNPLLSLQRPSFSNIEQASYDYKTWMIQNFENYKKSLK
jgi:GR25 family glycosyltransferase involved in LPS biosynthesis